MLSTARTTQYGNSIYEFEVFGTLQTGIEDLQAANTFSVYPNPSTGDIVNISFSSDRADGEALMSIANIAGQIVYVENILIQEGKAAGISIQGNDLLKPGTYILSVKGKNLTRHTILIIK